MGHRYDALTRVSASNAGCRTSFPHSSCFKSREETSRSLSEESRIDPDLSNFSELYSCYLHRSEPTLAFESKLPVAESLRAIGITSLRK